MNICKQCNKKEVPKGRVYCSASCQHNSMKKYPLSRLCAGCDEPFIIMNSLQKNNKFCGQSCAATTNNKIYIKRKRMSRHCEVCDKIIRGKSDLCQRHYAEALRKEKIQSWLSGEWDGAQPCGDLSQWIRNYLIELADNYCSHADCVSEGRQIPNHPSDGRSVLEINHINGDGLDHRPENLEAICPTCHSLTINYRGRNIGNGRPVFYRRNRI